MWRPEGWEHYLPRRGKRYSSLVIIQTIRDCALARFGYEAGADAMHQADVDWLLHRITYQKEQYIFKMTEEEWQEFIT